MPIKENNLLHDSLRNEKVNLSLLTFTATFAISLSISVDATPLLQLDSTFKVNDNNISSTLVQPAKIQKIDPTSSEGKLLNSLSNFYKKQLIKSKNRDASNSFLPQAPLFKKSQKVRPLNTLPANQTTVLTTKGKAIKSDLSLKLSNVGTPTFLSGFNKQPAGLSPSYKIRYTPDAYAIKSKNLAFFDKYSKLLKLEIPEQELNVKKIFQGELGLYHTKYTQQYKGIPIWKSELTTHSNQLGDVVGMTGKYIPSPSNISVIPNISELEAINSATSALSIDTNQLKQTTSRLIIYPDKNRIAPLLAWEVKFKTSDVLLTTALIDAQTGKTILTYDNIRTENIIGSGTDSTGENRKINVWHKSGSYSLNDASKSMFDASTMNPLDFEEPKGVINVYDAKNQPSDNDISNLKSYYRITSDSPDQDWIADGVSASYNLSLIYDYYKKSFNRNSIDGKGGRITGLVRYGNNYDNAFFAGGGIDMMFFGTAQDYASSLDVVAHEVSHGVTNAESDLVYKNQSGAINESLSDIFGELIESYVTGSTDWLMGTTLSEPLRNMKDPSSLEVFSGQAYPSKMSEYFNTTQDNGGVHVNSSIPNHAFYLLAEGGSYAIGLDEAAKVFYRANTTHLLPRSEFSDLRQACIQSADELFGENSKQSKAVASAFDAVEIYDTPTTPPSSPGKPSNSADSVIHLTVQNGKMYLGRYEKDLDGPDGGVYFKAKEVGGHRPAVSGDGTVVAFISNDHDFCTADTKTAKIECVNEKDSFFSVALSPDNHYISLILKDPNADHAGLPAILLLDLTKEESKFVKYDLKAAKVDDSGSNKIDTADAMDFSANSRYLVYDALNTFTANSKKVNIWSIYALDLKKNETIAMIKPKVGRQVGNPSLSNINNDFMTFDLYDAETQVVNVVYADLSKGKVYKVAESTEFTVPSFTGDDKSLVYSVKDSSTAIGYSLNIKPLTGGTAKKWISNAHSGIVYRRGNIQKPASIDLQVTQTVKVTPNSNDSVTFKITVKNAGPDTASNVVLANNFTNGLSLTGSTPSNCKKVNNQKIECKIASLNSGASKSFELILKAIKTGDQSNSAQVAASEEDSDTNNNTHVVKFKINKIENSSGDSKSGGNTSWLLLCLLVFIRAYSFKTKQPRSI